MAKVKSFEAGIITSYEAFSHFLEQFPKRVIEAIHSHLYWSEVIEYKDIVRIDVPKRGYYFVRWRTGSFYGGPITDAIIPGRRYSFNGISTYDDGLGGELKF